MKREARFWPILLPGLFIVVPVRYRALRGCGKRLHNAVLDGDVEAVKVLLEKGADVEAKN